MYPYQRQIPPPPVSIQGLFGPYDRRELEAARSQLIRDVYMASGGILTRVKMKCGIIANSNGRFTGCEPHPVTGVSYESQSCSLVMEENFPWKRDPKPPSEEQNGSLHGECSTGYSDERTPGYSGRDTGRDDTPDSERSRVQDNNMPSTSSSGTKRKREDENVDEMLARPTKTRKSEEEDNDDGISVSDNDEDGNADDDDDEDEDDDDDDDDDDFDLPEVADPTIPTQKGLITCFKCDLCDYVTTKVASIESHLKEKLHYSASKYSGIMEREGIVPKYLLKIMEYRHKPGQFHSAIPMCPQCNDAFNDIHSCYTHNQQIHKARKPRYALGTVGESQTVVISRDPTCNICKKHFNKVSALNAHVKAEDHNIIRKTKRNEVALMFCVYCNDKMMFTDIHVCRHHLVMKHGNRPWLEMKIIFVEKQNKVREMTRWVPRSMEENLRDDLIALRKLRRETSTNKRRIKRSIRELNERYESIRSKTFVGNLLR